MPVIQALVQMPSDSGLPEDTVTNTLHFQTEAAWPHNNFPNLDDIIFDFYDGDPDSLGSICSLIPAGDRNGEITVTYYNLSDSKPRTPEHEETRSVTFSNTSSLPTEVALVLSFQGAKESGMPQARRRNRIYIGPLREGTSTSGVVATTTIPRVTNAAMHMLSAANSSLSWTWVAYSPTNGTGVPVDNGWVDNAFDTQRRRGIEATSRTLFDDSNYD